MSSRRKLSFTQQPEQCELCTQHHAQLSQPSQWKSERARKVVESLSLPVDVKICRACRRDIDTVISDSDFTPRWEKRKRKAHVITCTIDNCNDNVFVSSKVITQEKFQFALPLTGLVASGTIPTPTPLCEQHYKVIYNTINPSQSYCITCSSGLKSTNARHCPNPDLEGGEFIDKGFLAFLRLIGTIYFKKHASGFESPTPFAHFKKFISATNSTKQHHIDWIADIRNEIWCRTRFENQMIPSIEAHNLHWQRSCWVINIWGQAHKNNMILPNIEQFGWKIIDNSLTIVWDTDENIKTIHRHVAALLKGCKCSTGCSTGRCGCKRKGSLCMEGCECRHCTNMQTAHTPEDTRSLELVIEEDASMTDPHDPNELMDWIFGPNSDCSGSEDSDSDSDSEY